MRFLDNIDNKKYSSTMAMVCKLSANSAAAIDIIVVVVVHFIIDNRVLAGYV